MTSPALMPNTGLTERLARFSASSLDITDDRIVETVRHGFIDAIGCMAAGSTEPVVSILSDFVRRRNSHASESGMLLGIERAAIADAALVNGTAAHALDYDDVALGGHPSAVLMPAVLAAGEFLDASGADVIRAYLAGYEVWAELASREPDAYHEKGWHPTAVLGTIASAAAVCNLYRLPQTQCGHALALAASMASGLIANFGTMAKPLHAGRAAACGIDAVHLAKAGMAAAPDVFEHRVGYLAALSPRGKADRSSDARELGTQFRMLDTGLSIKRYPMCYGAHRVIDGVLDLAAAADVRPEQVREVRVSIGPAQASMLKNHSAVNALEAKFSLEFAVASALVAGKVGMPELSDAFVASQPVQMAMAKVRTEIVDTRCPIEPVFAFSDRVVIDLANGITLDSGDIRFARGNAMLPLRPREVEAKFFDCVAHAGLTDARRLFESLQGLQDLDSVRRLRKAVATR